MASMVKYIVEMLGMFVKKVANNNNLIPQTGKHGKPKDILLLSFRFNTHKVYNRKMWKSI